MPRNKEATRSRHGTRWYLAQVSYLGSLSTLGLSHFLPLVKGWRGPLARSPTGRRSCRGGSPRARPSPDAPCWLGGAPSWPRSEVVKSVLRNTWRETWVDDTHRPSKTLCPRRYVAFAPVVGVSLGRHLLSLGVIYQRNASIGLRLPRATGDIIDLCNLRYLAVPSTHYAVELPACYGPARE